MGKNNNYRGNDNRKYEKQASKYPPVDPDEIDRLDRDDDDENEDTTVENVIVPGKVSEVPNSLLYNTSGLSPVVVTYRITLPMLKQKFLAILKTAITDIENVTAMFEPSTGEIYFYAQFADNSKHFTDDSMKNTMLYNQRVQHYSPEVRAFAKKFGIKPALDCTRDKNNRIIGELGRYSDQNKPINMGVMFPQNKDPNNNRVASYSMRLSWNALVQIIFDYNGNGFNHSYNQRPPKCNLEAHFVYSPSGGFEFGRIDYLEVTKSVKMIGERETPMPVHAYNYRTT